MYKQSILLLSLALIVALPAEAENARTENDSKVLQTQVLERINQALKRDLITPAQAGTLTETLDKISNKEAWYKSRGELPPESVVNEDKKLLQALSQKIQAKKESKEDLGSAKPEETQAGNLIASALAKNKITSEEAELYYGRLAEIELAFKSLDGVKAPGDDARKAEFMLNLHKLGQEVSAKLGTN